MSQLAKLEGLLELEKLGLVRAVHFAVSQEPHWHLTKRGDAQTVRAAMREEILRRRQTFNGAQCPHSTVACGPCQDSGRTF